MARISGWFVHRLRVRYEETDRMGVVYHGNYLTWFEIARTEWTRAHGFAYRQIEELGIILPVVDISASYKMPARYDDEVDVRVRVTDMGPIRLSFEYDVRLASHPDASIVTGASTHAWLDRDWKPVRLSKAAPELYEALRRATEAAEEPRV